MPTYDSLTARECARRILAIERPLVLMHVRPDGDTVGTGAALCEIFRMLGRHPYYACADPIPARLSFLLQNYEMAEDFTGLSPVAVDVSTRSQLSDLADRIPPPVLMIDHHEVGEPFAPNYILRGISSAGEVLLHIVDELVAMRRIRLTRALAYPIYAAISSDTGCFRYSNATAETYRRAAKLTELGIDTANINHRLFESKTEKDLLAESFIAARIHTAAGGRVAYATVTRKEREDLGVLQEHFETAVDVVRSLDGVTVAFIVRETDRGEIKVSMRSTGANVAEIAKLFGGGGHTRAAGCSLNVPDVQTGAQKILRAVLETAI